MKYFKIKGFPQYRINLWGEVITNFNRDKWEELKPSRKDDGTRNRYYWMVGYSKVKCVRADELVLQTFNSKYNKEDYYIVHRDNDYSNNAYFNLTIKRKPNYK